MSPSLLQERSQPRIAGQLIAAIMRGEYAAGAWLVEQELAQRFEVSRTPVREALSRLVGLGLIELHRNRGARVLPFGPAGLAELYQVRAILEAEAARQAAGAINPQTLALLREEMQRLLSLRSRDSRWSQREITLDEQFHLAVAEAAGNGRLEREIARYHELIAAVRQLLGRHTQAQQRAVHEHLTIIDHLAKGTTRQAGRAMRDHIEASGRAAVVCVFS